ncbi:MAG: hypothetical protein ACE5IB_01995, partial [Candidatus Geothermarchaeales archaeon]
SGHPCIPLPPGLVPLGYQPHAHGHRDPSHEALRQWYERSRGLFQVEVKRRRAMAVDETKVKVRGSGYTSGRRCMWTLGKC